MLLVEDDPTVRAAMTRALRGIGHVVRPVGCALDALRAVTDRDVDVVVLDLGLPDLDGAEALRLMRGVSDVPVIVATARSDERTTVRLLNAGADDYIVKPFSSEHIGARIAAVLRRIRSNPDQATAEHVVVGSLRIDVTRREATLAERPITLTRLEFDLLSYLAHRVGHVVTKSELCREVSRSPGGGAALRHDRHRWHGRRRLGGDRRTRGRAGRAGRAQGTLLAVSLRGPVAR